MRIPRRRFQYPRDTRAAVLGIGLPLLTIIGLNVVLYFRSQQRVAPWEARILDFLDAPLWGGVEVRVFLSALLWIAGMQLMAVMLRRRIVEDEPIDKK